MRLRKRKKRRKRLKCSSVVIKLSARADLKLALRNMSRERIESKLDSASVFIFFTRVDRDNASDDLICMLRKANKEIHPQLYYKLEKEDKRLWPMGIILQYLEQIMLYGSCFCCCLALVNLPMFQNHCLIHMAQEMTCKMVPS